jgi:uncharacterized membrane protein
MLKRLEVGAIRKFVVALLGLSMVSAGFFVVSAVHNHSLANWYLLWNLFLAWLPVVAAYFLIRTLQDHAWSSWPGILWTLVWLVFLPNSFYMVSDFIHLQEVDPSNILYDSVMFTLFILNGLVLGYVSLYLVHVQLRQRLRRWTTDGLIGVILLLCSFAIYLGRDLRWNTWDVLVNPAGILFDVSERVLHPFAHSDTFTTTAIFFVFLSSIYWLVWSLVGSLLKFERR